MRISVSEISTFLRCRRLWHYAGDSQLHLTSDRPQHALVLGSGVHAALEEFYRTPADEPAVPPTATFSAWADEQIRGWARDAIPYDAAKFEETFDLGQHMLSGYTALYGDHPHADPQMRVLVSEQEFAVPIPDTEDGWLVGRLDGLVRDNDGRTWIIDHKTYTRAPTALHLNLQFLAYTWAGALLAEESAFEGVGVAPTTRVYGILYNGLRKQRPGPRVRDPLFRRDWVLKNADELAIFGQTLTQVYREMSNPTVAIYPTITRDCERCDFAEPCYAAQVGEDEAWLLQSNYRHRAPRGSVYTDEPTDE